MSRGEYVQQVAYVVGSMHPDAIVAAKARAVRDGVDLGPPWLPNDEGVLYGTRRVDRPMPPMRVGFPGPRCLTATKARVWPLPTVLGLTALAGTLAGLVAR